MEEGDAIVAYSESQDLIDEDCRIPVDQTQPRSTLLDRIDEYSDIYYDRSYHNGDDVSICNFSNLPKEINLEVDQVSEDHFFIKANAHDFTTIQNMNLEGRNLNATLVPNMDDNGGNIPNEVSHRSEPKDENYDNSNYPIAIDSQSQIEGNKSEEQTYSNNYSSESSRAIDHSGYPGFNKNEGKLVFKITRFNKLTQKEKVITKTKRIISKCPHTSMKYYAKGMCKKCYHSYGREKKAYVCPHSDKPLYAKGYCKQCYLSKYKQQMHVKLSFKEPMMRRQKQSVVTMATVNSDGLEPSKIVGDLYIDSNRPLPQL